MNWLTWPWRVLTFVCWFVLQVVRSNVAIVHDILTHADHSTPRIVRVPTRCTGDLEVALLSMAVSLIPGTLTVATRHVPGAQDGTIGSELFVHALSGSRSDVVAETAELERRLLHALRKEGMPR